MKLNLGCGTQLPDGWVNVDYALGARLAKLPLFRQLNKRLSLFNLDWDEKIYLHDLTKTFPWADSSVDVIYSSHTLEHFSRDDGRRFLAECHRVLRKDGIIRILVPDLRHSVTGYIDGQIPADDFVETLGVLFLGSNSKLKTKLSPFIQFPHKCMYDSPRLVEILDDIGFESTARAPFQSNIKEIQGVELESRTEHAVIVEGRKC